MRTIALFSAIAFGYWMYRANGTQMKQRAKRAARSVEPTTPHVFV